MLIPSPSLKAVILFKAINLNKPLTVILNLIQDLLTVMKQVLREILKQVQDDGDAVETRNLKRFILVYRLGIVAKPDRVMMQVAENICELFRKDSSTSEAASR